MAYSSATHFVKHGISFGDGESEEQIISACLGMGTLGLGFNPTGMGTTQVGSKGTRPFFSKARSQRTKILLAGSTWSSS